MKAHELAKLLLEGPDHRVIVRGYEAGVNDVSLLKACFIGVDELADHNYSGRHQQYDSAEDAEQEVIWQADWQEYTPAIEPAIELWGENK